MCLGIAELDRLERYERRALSRRKRAIEKFIDISNTTEGPKWEGFGISCILGSQSNNSAIKMQIWQNEPNSQHRGIDALPSSTCRTRPGDKRNKTQDTHSAGALLLRLHPRDLDHVRPLFDVGAQKLVELGGAHLERQRALPLPGLLHIGAVNHLVDPGVETRGSGTYTGIALGAEATKNVFARCKPSPMT